MSKEMSTREAVEEFKNWIEYEKTNKDKINKAEELITVQETILNLIQKLEEENKKKDETMDLMARGLYFVFDSQCQECCQECEQDIDTASRCIEQYFKRKAEEE